MSDVLLLAVICDLLLLKTFALFVNIKNLREKIEKNICNYLEKQILKKKIVIFYNFYLFS